MQVVLYLAVGSVASCRQVRSFCGGRFSRTAMVERIIALFTRSLTSSPTRPKPSSSQSSGCRARTDIVSCGHVLWHCSCQFGKLQCHKLAVTPIAYPGKLPCLFTSAQEPSSLRGGLVGTARVWMMAYGGRKLGVRFLYTATTQFALPWRAVAMHRMAVARHRAVRVLTYSASSVIPGGR